MGKRMDEINAKAKWERCTWCNPDLKTRTLNCSHGAKTLGEFEKFKKPTTEEKCEDCENFRSMYLETPITVSDFETETPDYWAATLEPVRIRLCEDKKTYLGFYLGEFPRYITTSYDRETQELKIGTCGNPAIFVPAKKKVYFGDESWWQRIDPDTPLTEIENITDDEIKGQWYMKMLQNFTETEEND